MAPFYYKSAFIQVATFNDIMVMTWIRNERWMFCWENTTNIYNFGGIPHYLALSWTHFFYLYNVPSPLLASCSEIDGRCMKSNIHTSPTHLLLLDKAVCKIYLKFIPHVFKFAIPAIFKLTKTFANYLRIKGSSRLDKKTNKIV